MTREQRNYIEDRLRTARNRFIDTVLAKSETMPVRVKEAQKVVAAWGRERKRLKDKISKRVHKESQKVRHAILFNEPADALKALERFERLKF